MYDAYINDQCTQNPFPLLICVKHYLKHFNSGYHNLGGKKEKYWERSGNHRNKELVSTKNQLALKKASQKSKQWRWGDMIKKEYWTRKGMQGMLHC